MLSIDEKYITENIKNLHLKLIRKDRTLVILGTENNIRSALIQKMDTLYLNIEKSSGIPNNTEEKDKNFVYKQINTIEKPLILTFLIHITSIFFSFIYSNFTVKKTW